MSVRQGEQLSEILLSRNLPWNRAWGGGAVVAGSQLPAMELAGGLRITVLSPAKAELERLSAYWADGRGMPRGSAEQAAASNLEEATVSGASSEESVVSLTTDEETGPSEEAQSAEATGEDGGVFNVNELARVPFVGDPGVANAASIAFLAEFYDRALLTAADAPADVLAQSIRQLLAQRRVNRLRVDAFVVSHGGSKRSTSRELLELLDCDRYLFSTSGAKFRHPHRETIARILTFGRAAPDTTLTLVFNYRSPSTQMWASPALQERYNYRAVYPASDAGGVTVSLL